MCAFHQQLGVTVPLDDAGLCWRCAVAPKDQENHHFDSSDDYYE